MRVSYVRFLFPAPPPISRSPRLCPDLPGFARAARGYALPGSRDCPDLPGFARVHSPKFPRSEEHTSELQSLMRISYAVFCLKKKNHTTHTLDQTTQPHTIKQKHTVITRTTKTN